MGKRFGIGGAARGFLKAVVAYRGGRIEDRLDIALALVNQIALFG